METSRIRRLQIRRLEIAERELRSGLLAKEANVRKNTSQVRGAARLLVRLSEPLETASGPGAQRSRAALRSKTEASLKHFEAELRKAEKESADGRVRLNKTVRSRELLFEKEGLETARKKALDDTRRQEEISELGSALKITAEAAPSEPGPKSVCAPVIFDPIHRPAEADGREGPSGEVDAQVGQECLDPGERAGGIQIAISEDGAGAALSWSAASQTGRELILALPRDFSRTVGRLVESELKSRFAEEGHRAAIKVSFEADV